MVAISQYIIISNDYIVFFKLHNVIRQLYFDKTGKNEKNYEKLTWYKTNVPKRLSGKRKDQHNHFGV